MFVLCFWLSNAPGNGWARALAMRMVVKQEALPLQRLENGRALRRHSPRGGKRIL
jgi:hypothetical protein